MRITYTSVLVDSTRVLAVLIQTTRFGSVRIHADDILRFPEGLPGLENCRDWVLLADATGDGFAWMQSVQRGEVALAVASPRRYVPGYQARVSRRELETLQLDDPKAAQVLVVMNRRRPTHTLNLKAPLVINVARRLGRQVITDGPYPLRYEVGDVRSDWREIA